MRRPKLPPVLSLLVIASLLALGCSASDEAATTSTTASVDAVPVATTTTTTVLTNSTTPEATATTFETPDLDTFCDAYLTYTSARDSEGRMDPLNVIWLGRGDDHPAGLSEALKSLATADYGREDIREYAKLVRDFVLPRCEDVYAAGITPVADDATAAEQFYQAIVEGDRTTARTLATAVTVALLEPWEPQATVGDFPTVDYQDGQFFVSLSPEFAFRCEVTGGIVTGCFFG